MSSGKRRRLGWITMRSRTTGRLYYYNIYTQETQWQKPRGRSATRYAALENEENNESDDNRSRSRSPVVRCSQIMITHVESSHPVDRHNKPVTRTKAEAKKNAIELRKKIGENQMTFEDAAKNISDFPSFNDGDLGPFRRDQIQTPLEAVIVSLDVGELSDVVESPSGYHIILRRE